MAFKVVKKIGKVVLAKDTEGNPSKTFMVQIINIANTKGAKDLRMGFACEQIGSFKEEDEDGNEVRVKRPFVTNKIPLFHFESLPELQEKLPKFVKKARKYIDDNS